MPSKRTNNFPESGRGLGHVISAQVNISPHYSFMVQNQITLSLCLSLLWSSTVGYPSDSLASCCNKI